jgi:hypothetical protein
MLTFAQGQIVLNTYYTIEFYPFVRTPKPHLRLSEQERERMLERIRRAKAELIPEGLTVPPETFRNVASHPLSFIPTTPELEDIILALDGVLAEGRLNPSNVEPIVGAGLEAVALLRQTLKNQ